MGEDTDAGITIFFLDEDDTYVERSTVDGVPLSEIAPVRRRVMGEPRARFRPQYAGYDLDKHGYTGRHRNTAPEQG